MSAWSHLPNAAHITSILESAQMHPGIWHAAWQESYINLRVYPSLHPHDTVGYNYTWNNAWRKALRDFDQQGFSQQKDRLLARHSAFNAATRGAVLALTTYDDCAHYLDLGTEQLRFVADLSGHPAPELLLPVSHAFDIIKELS